MDVEVANSGNAKAILFALIFPSHDICESKLGHVESVIGNGKHPAAAHLHFRRRQLELMFQAGKQLEHEPARDFFSFGGIDEAEVQKVNKQDFPVLLYRTKQPLPINFLVS